jgi:hypothetical protein
MALSSRRKEPVVSAGSRSTAPGGEFKASQRPSGQHGGKRKANELASLGDSFEPANRHPGPGAVSALLPANASAVTGEQPASSSLQLGPPEGGITYAAELARTVAPIQPSGSLKPTVTGSDLPNPLSHPRQPTGACLATCAGICVTSRMAPLHRQK